MDARERLRAFLRQQLEEGEVEFVLNHMTTAEALAAASGAGTGTPPGAAATNWRDTLRAAGAAAPETAAPETAAPETAAPEAAAAQSRPSPDVRNPQSVRTPLSAVDDESDVAPPRAGLVVGSDERSLFGGPLGDVVSLDGVAALVAACTRCPLHETARNPVPGTGSPRAGLMVVGEAPGATEDEQGKPFVGAAGQLLTKILSAIQLSREDVFITNVLKHRPPLNRNPLPHEVQACSPYLLRQLELIRPKAILALGTFAAQTLLQTNQTIGKLRGFIHRYHGIPLIVTYHPAALLRNPSWKRPTWQDVQLVRRILDSSTAA